MTGQTIDESSNPLMAALDHAGIQHRDLFGLDTEIAHRVILQRLREAGFSAAIDDGTLIEDAVRKIDAWNAGRER